jgi:hypothetical protein
VATGVRVSDVAPSPLAVHEVTQLIGHRCGSRSGYPKKPQI